MSSETSTTGGAQSRYRDAGVDIDRAEQSLPAIRRLARSTLSAEQQQSEIGHFGGVFPLQSGPDRLLVASADGIGTKIKLAFVLGDWAHRQVGADLVHHCVNDILACGARPLFFLDYVAMGKLDAVALEALVEGMAAACRENGIALIGGETAEMPGLYSEGEYDAAGFIVGEVAPDRFVDGHEVAAGDIVLGFLAVGLHTNGFSLARNIAGLSGDAEHDRALLESPLPGDPATTLAAALMAPHPSYVGQVRSLLDAGLVRGMAHITGGGLVDNVPRMIPDGLQAILDADTWTANPIFDYLVEQGSVPEEERYRVFNMGIGFVVAIRPDDVEMATALSPDAVRIGQIVAADAAGERKIWLVRGNRDIAG
jgi:phosphoribosylformylglycinamidine cyclo-ligase